MNAASTTHGAFSWTELTTSDPKDARRFYGKLLGWQFNEMDMGTGTYAVIQVVGEGIGGIVDTPPNAGSCGTGRRPGRPARRRIGWPRAARTDGHPGRWPLRDDHGPAGRNTVAHHLRQEELDAMAKYGAAIDIDPGRHRPAQDRSNACT